MDLQRHRSEYEVTFWIEAGSKEPIEHDFMHIYQSLFDVWMPAGQEVIKIDNAIGPNYPRLMILILTACVDSDIQPSIRKANIITQISLPPAAIATSPRCTINQYASQSMEIAEMSSRIP